MAPNATTPASTAAAAASAAPGRKGQNRHDDGGERSPLRIEPRSAEGEHGQHRQGGKRDRGDPIRRGLVVRCGKMRLERHAGGGERQLYGDMHEQRRAPGAGAASGRAEQGEPPGDRSGHHRTGQPQPAAHARQRQRGCRHDTKIGDQRPGTWLGGRDQHRHYQRARQPEPGQRRAVQCRGNRGGDADQPEQKERGCRSDEAIQGVRGVDGGETGGGAGGGQHARYMRRRDRLNGKRTLGTAEPFSNGDQGERQQCAERNAHPRSK